MSAPELKPCPFCKSRGIDRDSYWHRNYCTNCGARGPAAGNTVNADWNTRADLCDPTQDERVKRLVELLKKPVVTHTNRWWIDARNAALRDLEGGGR